MKQILVIIILFSSLSAFAQEKVKDSLKIELSEIKAEISKLNQKASVVQAKIDKLYGWKVNAFGSVGINISKSNNWHSNEKPNLSSGNINIVHNINAQLNREKYFWLSYLSLNLGWERSYNKDKDKEDKGWENENDIFELGSLFGYKLSEKFAISALTHYRGTFIKKFADPSFLDLGVGMSWQPINDFYIVANPLNYDFIFSGDDKKYQSSMGAKFFADYTGKFGKLNLNSNLTAFVSYKSSDLSSWTWKNSFSYSFWKGIGLGFNFGLRQNKQEAFNSDITNYSSLEKTDNNLQSFWMIGLSYAL